LISAQMKNAISLFMFAFVSTEVLLVLQATENYHGIQMAWIYQAVFALSCVFPLASLWMAIIVSKKSKALSLVPV
jgi:hypothetical protein